MEKPELAEITKNMLISAGFEPTIAGELNVKYMDVLNFCKTDLKQPWYVHWSRDFRNTLVTSQGLR